MATCEHRPLLTDGRTDTTDTEDHGHFSPWMTIEHLRRATGSLVHPTEPRSGGWLGDREEALIPIGARRASPDVYPSWRLIDAPGCLCLTTDAAPVRVRMHETSPHQPERGEST